MTPIRELKSKHESVISQYIALYCKKHSKVLDSYVKGTNIAIISNKVINIHNLIQDVNNEDV